MVVDSSRTDRWFFGGMAWLAVLLSALGFAPTFYWRDGELPPLAGVVVAHGVLGTAWLLTFAAQTALVASGRAAWHRAFGAFGVVLAVAFVAVGALLVATFERAHGPEPGWLLAPHLFTNVAPLVVFVVLVAAGAWQRHVPPRHKRFMVLAAVVLLPPAIGRLFDAFDLARFNLAVYASLAFATALYDLAVRGRPHPVSLWAAVALVAIDVTTTRWLDAVGS